MNVLLWSSNRILSDLVARNLAHRGFEVRETTLPPDDTPIVLIGDGADIVIVDLDCPEPELWRRAAFVRETVPAVPLVILGHGWPAIVQLDRLQPCTYVRKPFAIDELLTAVQEAPAKIR